MNGQSIFSVKKIKELDDNSPKKIDSKDPKTIAKLVVDGRYSILYMPEGVYAEIRDLVYSRDRDHEAVQHICKQDPKMACNTFPGVSGVIHRLSLIHI